MINLLLVEDEPPILRDIKIELEQYKDLFLVTATAFNGKEALDYLENSSVKIDVLITDIEMPVIGGLELISQVKMLYPSIICIILTGYSSFEYARQAITLGVCDYLLKPIDEAALKVLLDSIYHKICFEHLSSNLYKPSEITNLPISDSLTYTTCILCTGTFSLYSDYLTASLDCNWAQMNLDELIHRYLPNADSHWIISGKSENEKNIIFTFKKEISVDITLCLKRFFAALQQKNPYLNAIVQTSIKSMNEIGDSIQKLRKEFGNCFVLGRSQLFFSPAGIEKPDSLYQILNCDRDYLVTLFCQLNYPMFKEAFLSFLTQMDKNNCPENMVFYYLYELMNSCVSKIGHVLPNYLKNSISLLNDTFVLSDNFTALFENLLAIYEDLFHIIMNTQKNLKSQSQIMLLIDSYIKLNYQQQINTQTLSRRFNLSPAYLSKLFREYKEVSPAEYIINLRIGKAKQLFLSTPSSRIQDIALQVGYEDPLYFSKVFKKNTGLSPKEFAKNNHN